jgi:hypothetical protein
MRVEPESALGLEAEEDVEVLPSYHLAMFVASVAPAQEV